VPNLLGAFRFPTALLGLAVWHALVLAASSRSRSASNCGGS